MACSVDRTSLLTELTRDILPVSLLSKHLMTVFLDVLLLFYIFTMLSQFTQSLGHF